MAAGLSERLQNQPEVEAELRSTIGKAYLGVREYDLADENFERALHLRQQVFGELHEAVAESLTDLAWSRDQRGFWNPDSGSDPRIDSERLARDALQIYEKLSVESEGYAKALRVLAHALAWQNRRGEAEPYYRRALEAVRGSSTNAALSVEASILHNLADCMLQLDINRLDEATELAERSVKLHRQARGDDHPDTSYGLYVLAMCHSHQEKFREAEVAAREALNLQRADQSVLSAWPCTPRPCRLHQSAGAIYKGRVACPVPPGASSADL